MSSVSFGKLSPQQLMEEFGAAHGRLEGSGSR